MAKSALSTFFPVVVSTTSGIVTIPPVLVRVGRSFSLSGWQMVRKIYIPAMLGPLLTGLRLGMAMAIIGVLSAEIAYSDRGLGFRLIRNADQFQIPTVYALALIIFTIAATINHVIGKIEARYSRRDQRQSMPDARAMGLG